MSKAFYVVGGGPGGAGAAYAAGKLGYRVIVLEAMNGLALKPCGRGIPVTGDLPFSIPKEAVLNNISYVDLYVDGTHLFKAGGFLRGVIVDKRLLLEHAFSSVGAEVYYNSKYDIRRGVARIGGDIVEVNFGVFAGGFAYYDGERIPVVQYVVAGVRDVDFESIEIRFDTRLLGYYYVFPHGDEVEVGVGGFESHGSLWRLLDKFIENDPRLRSSKVRRREAAVVSIGGLRLGYIGKLVKVGEAAGYVLPLTGEGIRPSIISGYVAAKAMIEGRDPLEALRRSWVSRAIRIQRRLLEWAGKLSVEERRSLLRGLGPLEHAEIALGTLRLHRLASRLLLKPRIAIKLIPRILMG